MGETLKTAVYILNRIPSKAVTKTPYEMWTGKVPSIRHLHIWGCPAEAKAYKPHERKLDSRTVSCYFVGYAERSRGFKFFIPTTRTFFETGNARFIDNVEFGGKNLERLSSRKRNLFLFQVLLWTILRVLRFLFLGLFQMQLRNIWTMFRLRLLFLTLLQTKTIMRSLLWFKLNSLKKCH